MTLVEAIRRIVKEQTRPEILVGKVKSFDADKWLAVIELNQGATIDEVRIKSVINSETSGIFIEPKIGSYVLVGKIENKLDSLFILGFSEVVKYQLNADLITFNGDSFGGIVKSEKIHNEIEDIKNDLNSLKQVFTTWVTVPNDGGAALKASTSAWSSQHLIIPTKDSFENTKVKHG